MERKLSSSGRSLSTQSLTHKLQAIRSNPNVSKISRSSDSARDLIKKATLSPECKIKPRIFNQTRSSLELTYKLTENKPFSSTFRNLVTSRESSSKEIINLIRSHHQNYLSQNKEILQPRISREKPSLYLSNLKHSDLQMKTQSDPNTRRVTSERSRPHSRRGSADVPIVKKTLQSHVVQVCFKTRTGSVAGKKKPNNQDNFLIESNFARTENQFLFAVMDGHGLNGHDVSAFVKRVLPLQIENLLPMDCNNNLVHAKLEDPLPQEDILKLKQVLLRAHLVTNSDLNHSKAIDISYSGTTSVSVLLRGKLLLCSNVGDSRAVLGRYDHGKWSAIPLSRDHKPNDLHEQSRIERHGGRVEPFRQPSGRFLGPSRVWMKNEQIPGLAMSRSIGDHVASQVGVIAEPEITERILTAGDKFIVIASDGLWEFISNEECINLISNHYETSSFEPSCDKLVNEAVKRWKQEDEVIDDITLIIIYLNM